MGTEMSTPMSASSTAQPPTFKKMIEKIMVELSPFKRILTEEDNIVFDKIMDYTRKNIIQEEGESFFPGAFDAMNFLLLSILIGQQKEIDKLNETIKILTK